MIFRSVQLLCIKCNCGCSQTHTLNTFGSKTANVHGQTIVAHVMPCELSGYCNCFSILCTNLDYIPHKPNLRSGQHSIRSRVAHTLKMTMRFACSGKRSVFGKVYPCHTMSHKVNFDESDDSTSKTIKLLTPIES